MTRRKLTPLWVSIIALFIVIVAVAVGYRLLNGDNSLLRDVSLNNDTITPNADGDTDATLLSYNLSRNADVSIYFENEEGRRFYFREEKPRGAGEYQVLFSGIVDGYSLPDDEVQGKILSRLLQDGAYTWTVQATDTNGVTETEQGSILVVDADTDLPDLRDFTLDFDTFTPNRDGISDRVKAQFYLTKEVDEVRVFLRLPDGSEVPISELEREIPAKMPGRHVYDYEGGVDNGATPPPDGMYPIIAEARDLEGQRIRVEDSLTIQYGGVPRADIFAPPAGDTLDFSATAVAHCDTLTYPAFLYESLWSLLAFLLLYVLVKRYAERLQTGELTALYLILYAIGRTLLEQVRLDSRLVTIGSFQSSMAVATLVSILIAILAGSWVIWRRLRKRRAA